MTPADGSAYMYLAIDEFLEFSKRYDPETVKKRRRSGIIGGFGIGGGALAFSGVFVFFFVILSFIALSVGVYNLAAKGRHAIPEIYRMDKMIEHDGLEKVYNDLQRAKKIGGTNAYTGGTYLFVKGQMMCRNADIKKLFIDSAESPYKVERSRRKRTLHKKDQTYTITAEIRDEIGAYTLALQNVSALGEQGRRQRLEAIRADLNI